jgi:hypothetical protein
MNEIARTTSDPRKIRCAAADFATDPTVHRTAEAADIAYHAWNQRKDNHLSFDIYVSMGNDITDMFINRKKTGLV